MMPLDPGAPPADLAFGPSCRLSTAFLRSMRLAFAVFSVLSVVGIVASLRRNVRPSVSSL